MALGLRPSISLTFHQLYGTGKKPIGPSCASAGYMLKFLKFFRVSKR